MTLGIFSCVCQSSYIFCGGVFIKIFCPFFLCCLLINELLKFYIFWICKIYIYIHIYILHIRYVFSQSVACLHFVSDTFARAVLLFCRPVNQIFLLLIMLLVSYVGNLGLAQGQNRFSPLFSSRSFIVLQRKGQSVNKGCWDHQIAMWSVLSFI